MHGYGEFVFQNDQSTYQNFGHIDYGQVQNSLSLLFLGTSVILAGKYCVNKTISAEKAVADKFSLLIFPSDTVIT